MILESKTDTLVLEEGEVQESTEMVIDVESHGFLMRMLSKFYSDGVGSSIREVASNALDSHRACGVTDPIIVSLKKNRDNNWEFSVQDFGCGLDNNDIENIIKKYGKSTKRQSANQLGAFGLGFKSPLAYSTSFYFVARKDGIERKYMMYESDDESNKIDLLYESPTTERNGVVVIIPVKNSDYNEFYNKIKVQLAYFESVYFDCTNGFNTIKNEDIKIYRGKDFQWSSLASDKYMHICLDNVYYPIDWDKLGISSIYFPVGLRFSLSDGIFPVPNREQLKYTAQAKDIIINKINRVSNYFIEKYNENTKEGESVRDVFDHYSTTHRNVNIIPGAGNFDVSLLEKHSDVKIVQPKLKGIKLLSIKRLYAVKDFLVKEYSTKYTYKDHRFKLETTNWGKTFDWRTAMYEPEKVYVCTELSGIKKIYFRDTLGYNKRYFITKDTTIKLGKIKRRYSGDICDYYHILELWDHPKSEWRERIKEWQSIVQMIVSKFNNADLMDIPQFWHDERKAERMRKMVVKGTNVRQKKLEGEVGGKVASSLERYVEGKNCKFSQQNFKLSEAHKKPYLIIYGNSENEPLFQKLYTIVDNSKIKLVIFSDRELKNLKDVKLHNWIEINTFMTGKHKVYRRLVTAYLINKLSKEYQSVFRKTEKMKKVSSVLADKIAALNGYEEEYFEKGDEILYKAMLTVAEEQKLFDYSIYGIYKEVEFILNRLPFVEAVFSTMTSRDDSNDLGMLRACRDLFKYYKQRMDWQNYKLIINEEEIKEEETDQN